MTFVPNEEIPNNRIGKEYHTRRDVRVLKGTLLAGSTVLVIGVSSRGYDIKDIESGEEFIEVGFDVF